MKFSLTIILIAVFCLQGISLLGQQSVWNESQKQMENWQQKSQKKISKIKQWKDHVNAWGLDSNFNHALSISGRLNTNGWSGGLVYLHQTSAGKKTIWQLHFSEIKHEKETKQQRTDNTFGYLGKSRPYIFGKLNNAYTLQLGYGKEQMLLPALLNGNLSVSLRYLVGPAVAFLKPVYLNLISVSYNPDPEISVHAEKYNADNASRFLDANWIQGGYRWSKGISDMKYIPGLFAELAFAVEPEKPKSFVKTILIGGNFALYSSKLEIMAEQKAYPYQANFFVSLCLGKRW